MAPDKTATQTPSHRALPKMAARVACGAFVAVLALAVPVRAHAQSAAGWAKRGQEAETREDWDGAFEDYRQARLLKPNDLRYRTKFERARFAAAAAHVDRGRVLRQNGDLNGAMTEFQRAIAIDGGNQAAQQEITVTEGEINNSPESQGQMPAPAGPSPDLSTLGGPLTLKPVSNDPITLHMVEDTKVLYQAVGKAAGLNVIFDPDYQSKRVPLDVTNVSLSDALRILGTLSGTFFRPITSNTIFVAANTRAKRTDLEPMAVQTFYLSNAATQADQNELLTALRQVLDPNTKIFLVPSQNAILVRATPDELLLTQDLLNNLDRPRSEVVVDVAVLEVNRDKARNLGITLPQSFSITPQVNTTTTTTGTTTGTGVTPTGGTTSDTNSLTLANLRHLTGSNFGVTIGTAAVNALLNDSDTRILQSPRIRATDNQKADFKVGERIPVATGSFSTGASTAIVSSLVNTQFTYLDVGVEVEMTPTVHQDRDVSLKMKIIVSSENGQSTISGVTEPIIAQRTIDQTVELKEGEPSVLGGILSRTETRSLTGTPGLSDLPILRDIFSSNSRETVQDEIVFVMIPHIVREPMVTRMNTRAIDTGTGAGIELRRDISAVQNDLAEAGASGTPASIAGAGRTTVNRQPRTTAAQAASSMIGINLETAAIQAAQKNIEAQRAQAAGNPGQQTVAGGPPVTYTIVPPTSTQGVGSTFQMAVLANGARDLYSVPLQVKFNDKVLSLVNVDSGELLARDGQSVAVVHRDEGNGNVAISITRPPAVKGMDGSGTVCVLTFKANTPGVSDVELVKTGAKNSSQVSMPATGSRATVQVH